MKNLIMGPLALTLSFACSGQGQDVDLEPLEKRVAALEAKVAANAKPRAPARRNFQPDKVYRVPVNGDEPFVGREDAKVTIVTAYEFACPYCARVDKTINEAVADPVEQDVRWVQKSFVVHPQVATLPALAMCAAKAQDKHEAFARALWTDAWPAGQRMNAAALSRDALVASAKKVGLDPGRFVESLDGNACKAQLARDRKELAALGVAGTPTIFVNGRPFSGPRTVEGFKGAIARASKEADAQLAAGVPRSKLYEALTKNGLARK